MKQEKIDFLLRSKGKVDKVDTIFYNLTDHQRASIKKDIITMLNQPKVADDTFIKNVMAKLFGCESYEEWKNLSKHVERDVKDVFVNPDRIQGFYDSLNESFEVFVDDLEDNIKSGNGTWIKLLKLKIEPVIAIILEGDQTGISLEEFETTVSVDEHGKPFTAGVNRILKKEFDGKNTTITFVPESEDEDDGVVLNKPI